MILLVSEYFSDEFGGQPPSLRDSRDPGHTMSSSQSAKNDYQEASDMLAEALKQMDGILAGTVPVPVRPSNGNHNTFVENGGSPKMSTSSPKLQQSRAVKLLNDLRVTLEGVEDKQRVLRQLSPETHTFLGQWLGGGTRADHQGNHQHTNGFSASADNLVDKVRRLETDKDNLSLQVSVLTDQIEAQLETIHDLQSSSRDQAQHRLNGNSSPYTDQDVLNRSPQPADSQRLDLMAENSNLRLKLSATERDKHDVEDRLLYAQKRIDELQSRLNQNVIEVTELRSRVARTESCPSSPSEQSDPTRERTMERERTLDRLKRKHTEVDKLKKAVDSLMVDNKEKDHHIEELKKLIRRYKRIEDMVLSAQGKKGLENLNLSFDDDVSDSSSTQNSNTSGHDHTIRDAQQPDQPDKLSEAPRLTKLPYPSATSTPVSTAHMPRVPGHMTMPNGSPTVTPVSHTSTSPSPRKSAARSNSLEDVNPADTTTPPTVRRAGPSFAQTETDEEALKDEMAQQYKALQTQNPTRDQPRKKTKGFKRLFGKLKRTNSQDMEDDKTEEFRRNALRSTAGPRLGWSKDFKYTDIDVPFARWDCDRVCMWLHAMGLSMYVGDCKRWVKNGDQLLKANTHDLEKELGVKNHFHRKKLQLALQAAGSESKSPSTDLDYNWVTRWLDDIGLPQYKDMFSEARVDGNMLNYLTVDELVLLRVTNSLHHLSIKRGIQVLRLNNFNPACLRRRPSPEEGQLQNVPGEVSLWTNHRVMEWLRCIDLSEYAPNLRGSGVHGGLMVLEARFSADIFATLLSIPTTKSLLRRHLSTHFVALIGNDTQAKKREFETQQGFIPLTPNQKVKLKKRLFSHKRTKSDPNDDDFVCPPDSGVSGTLGRNGQSNGRATLGRDHSPARDKENMLSKERFLDSVPTSDV